MDEIKKGFKISVRFNENSQLYECYKVDFSSDEEVILFQAKQLKDMLKRTNQIYNEYARKLAKEEIKL